jgi:hypothetical protein
MKILDKIYLHLYWCTNNYTDKYKTTIWGLNVLLIPIMLGLILVVLCFVLKILVLRMSPNILLIISGVSSYFISYKLISIYYDNEKQKFIVLHNKKPGLARYAILLCLTLMSLAILVSLALLGGIIIHRGNG